MFGSSGIPNIYFSEGSPINKDIDILNVPSGSFVIDTTTPALYQKTSAFGDNSGYTEVGGAGTAGSVLLRNPDGTSTSYTPAGNTNGDRETSLRAAIAAAVDDSTIYLYNCRASVTTTSLSASLTGGVTQVTLQFDDDSAVIYADPTLATSDHGFFKGPRNVRHFGAVEDGNTTSTDNLPFFNAAFNSLDIPYIYNLDKKGRMMRQGTIFIPSCRYEDATTGVAPFFGLSDTFYFGNGVMVVGENYSDSLVGLLPNSAPAAIAAMPTIGTFTVNTGTGAVTCTAHGLSNYERVEVLNSGGALPTGNVVGTYTAANATNVFTLSAHGLLNGDSVVVSTSGAFPTGLAADTVYFIRDKTTDTFKLSATRGGTAIDISSDGTGTQTLSRAGLRAGVIYTVLITGTNTLTLCDGPSKAGFTSYLSAGTGTHTLKKAEMFAIQLVEGNSINTTHQASIRDINIANSYTGNPRGSGIWFMTAQLSTAYNIAVGWVGQRSFVGNPQVFHGAWMPGANVGPILELFQAPTCATGMSIEHNGVLVDLSAEDIHYDEDGDPEPAVLIRDCSAVHIAEFNGEFSNCAIKIKNSIHTNIETVRANSARYGLFANSGSGLAMIIIRDCSGVNINGMEASGYEYILKDYGRQETINGNSTGLSRSYGYSQYQPRLETGHYGSVELADWIDGSSVVGNGRGYGALDLSRVRAAAANVASGSFSAQVGYNCRAAGAYSVAIGSSAFADHAESFARGQGTTTGSAGQDAYAQFGTAESGTALYPQVSQFLLAGYTTDATPLILFKNQYAKSYVQIPSNRAYAFRIVVTAAQSAFANAARFERTGMIQNNAGTTALVGSVSTVGTDINTDGTWSIAVTADDTNDRLQIEVTGKAAQNIHWSAYVQAYEVNW